MKNDKGRELKPHIGIFGRRNNGKSAFINAMAGQEIAIVSPQPGTTTDPVRKSVEIFGIGPSVLIDTAGIDDQGELGELRVKKTLQVIRQIDLAVILITKNEIGEYESGLAGQLRDYTVPFFFIHHKSDEQRMTQATKRMLAMEFGADSVEFSSWHPDNQEEVIGMFRKHMPPTAYQSFSMLGGLIGKGDLVLLITPIDLEAPEGRLILPQVQVLRDILDNRGIAIVLKETELEDFILTSPLKPKLVITDSQAFEKVSRIIPEEIPLTGFSVLLARHKGRFGDYLAGTPEISNLKDGDRVLILESCTHQVNCDDIGRYKLPKWIREFTGKNILFDVISGMDHVPDGINRYALVVQCGGCMITRQQIHNRLKPAVDANVPITNYGMAIAWMKGIFPRAIAPFRNSSPVAEPVG